MTQQYVPENWKLLSMVKTLKTTLLNLSKIVIGNLYFINVFLFH